MRLITQISPQRTMLIRRNLETGGKVQQFIDSECIRRMKPYTPFLSGTLERSATIGTVIGSGRIIQKTPYAHYQYYGVVYGPNIPIFRNGILEGFYSPPAKLPTGSQIKYSTAKHPKAGKMWFERMKSDCKDDILRGALRVSGGTSSR